MLSTCLTTQSTTIPTVGFGVFTHALEVASTYNTLVRGVVRYKCEFHSVEKKG